MGWSWESGVGKGKSNRSFRSSYTTARTGNTTCARVCRSGECRDQREPAPRSWCGAAVDIVDRAKASRTTRTRQTNLLSLRHVQGDAADARNRRRIRRETADFLAAMRLRTILICVSICGLRHKKPVVPVSPDPAHAAPIANYKRPRCRSKAASTLFRPEPEPRSRWLPLP